MTFQRCTVSGNRAIFGSPVIHTRGKLSILDSTITGKSGANALSIDLTATVTLTGSIVAGNSVSYDINNLGQMTAWNWDTSGICPPSQPPAIMNAFL